MTGPSRSSPWGIQRGKEIPETVKTGTKHQNKKQNKKQKKKRKVVNTRRTKGEKRHAGKKIKIKCFSISMPKPIEHNSRNQGCNSKQDKSRSCSLNRK